MKINSDFNQRVVVHSARLEWLDSPMPGVQRRPLDRVGGEVARATSVVRYAPGSEFSPHVHTGGEEFFVLDGVFQDEHGDFPTGSYIRNPPQSKHKPGSLPGCTILVKLWQFDPDDRTHVRLQTGHMSPVPHRDLPGVEVIPLFVDEREEVSLHNWQPLQTIELTAEQGLEVFVLEGSFTESDDELTQHSWIRVPPSGRFKAISGKQGARVWIKQNHLGDVKEQIQRVLGHA